MATKKSSAIALHSSVPIEHGSYGLQARDHMMSCTLLGQHRLLAFVLHQTHPDCVMLSSSCQPDAPRQAPSSPHGMNYILHCACTVSHEQRVPVPQLSRLFLQQDTRCILQHTFIMVQLCCSTHLCCDTQGCCSPCQARKHSRGLQL